MLSISALHLLAAVFFALTARTIFKRGYDADVRSAGYAFVFAWVMLAVMAGSDGLRLLLAAAGADLSLYATLARVKTVATALMIAGFGYFVLYIWTGKKQILIPLAAYALFHSVFYLYLIEHRVPTGIVTQTWGAAMTFESPPLIIADSSLVTYFVFFAPPIVLGLLFLTLLFRFGHTGQRMRAGATASVVILYHSTGFLLFFPNTELNLVAKPVLTTLMAASAALAWFVYRNPASDGAATTEAPAVTRTP